MRNIMWMVVVCVLVTIAGRVSGDWTSQCPSKCSCKWNDGKRLAYCVNAGFNTIPTNLSPEVQQLDLSGNPLHHLPAAAFSSVGLENLQRITLKNCSLDTVDKDAFQNLNILVHVDLSGNLLERLDPATFAGNQKLGLLKLSYNPLGKLVAAQFPRLPLLRTVELEGAALETIDDEAFVNFKGVDVTSLKLSFNKLTTLKTNVLAPMEKLASLDLQGNPWLCDCRIRPLWHYLREKKLNSASTLCAEPRDLSGRPWNSLNSDDFACRPTVELLESLVESRPGFDVTFACRVGGSPAPRVSWVLQNRQVVNVTHNSNSDQFFIHEGLVEEPSSSGENDRWSNLTLRRVTDQDAGEYLCVARNKGGVNQVNVSLHLLLAPIIDLRDYYTGISPETVIGIAAAITATLLIALILLTVFLCRRHKRKIRQNRHGGSKAGGNLDSPMDAEQEKSLLEREMQDMSRIRTTDGYQAVPQTDQVQGSCTYIPGEKYDDRLGDMNSVIAAGRFPQDSSSSRVRASFGGEGSLFPDLLNITHHSRGESPSAASAASTLPESSRLAMTLNPAHLAGHPNYASPAYRTLGLPYHKPLHYNDSIGSANSAVVLPAGNRPGYVTLPRRPRPRVPSWASTPVASPSPTGDRQQPLYDTIGPRITADGSSTSALSLNRIAGLSPLPTSPNPSTISSASPNRVPKTSLPAYYVPIQEVDIPPPSPLVQRNGRSSALPQSTPNILEAGRDEESRDALPSFLMSPSGPSVGSHPTTSTPNSAASHTSPEILSPIADFRMPGNRSSISSVTSNSSNATGAKKKIPPAVAPKPQRPGSVSFPAQRASIAEAPENNDGLNSSVPNKVPPKPPPKPKKRSTVSESDILDPANENEALYEDEGEDGTEV